MFDLNPDELHYNSFMASLESYLGSCKILNDLSGRKFECKST